MVCGLVIGLGIYSFVVTCVLVVISALYAYSPTGSRITCKENHGDDNSKSQTHVDLFNVDISENSNDGNGENCSVIEILGFRVFETIVLTLLFLGMIFVAFKMVIRIKHFLLKQTEMRELAEKRRLEKMRLEYEKNKARPKQRDIDEVDACADEPETSPAQRQKKMTVKFHYTSKDQ